MKTKLLTILFTTFLLFGCTTPSTSTTKDKTLNVPTFEELLKIDTLYVDEKDQTYSLTTSLGEHAFKPSYYDLLKDAKYVGKMKDNDVLDVANVTLTIWESETDKVNYVIYEDGDTCYLEDVANLDLYTVSSDVYDNLVEQFDM